MQPIGQLEKHSIENVFCDIDDTLTTEGKLTAPAYEALWKLDEAGINVIPVTGRPAGWCEMIARQWPVHGVVGENGGLYFRHAKGQMLRFYAQSEGTRTTNLSKLQKVKQDILQIDVLIHLEKIKKIKNQKLLRLKN
mgnify:CR=1 FL=1